MWDEAVPDMQGEVWVTAAQACDEVILVILDCTFCGIGAMKVWGHELELDTSLAYTRFEAAGAFIVQNLVLGGEASVGEVGVEDAGGWRSVSGGSYVLSVLAEVTLCGGYAFW